MDESHELHIPDCVPDEMVAKYGGKVSARPTRVGRSSPPRRRGRLHDRLSEVALASSVAALVGILIAVVAAAPEPLVAAGWMLVLVLVAAVAGRLAAYALLRAGRVKRRPR